MWTLDPVRSVPEPPTGRSTDWRKGEQVSRAEIKQFVLSEFAPDVRADELDDGCDLLKSIIDSLGLLRLVAWIGERFAIPVEDISLSPSQFRSINAIEEFVESNSTVLEGR
jgi:acyl carrier protein